jgi:hypothetical protein
MSYIVLHDRIKETSRTQGTGPFELEGAVAGFSAFSDVYATGDAVFYAITDGTDYEIGSGIYDVDSTDQLSRFVIKSSNSNALVDFPAGLKEVYVTYPATNSVYHGSGLSDLQTPEEGGVAFWVTNNIVGYDDNITWDSGYVRLGIRNRVPDYAIDVGGNGYESNIQASGFLVGTSGVYFPEANNGDSEYPGGRQVVHFEPNEVLDVDVQQYAAFSGDVNQYLYFRDQTKGHVLAGPPSGCAGDCSPATPTFRLLTLEDIPDLDSLYATDGQLANVSGVLLNYTYEVSGVAKNHTIQVSGFLEDQSDANRIVLSGVLRNYTDEQILAASGFFDTEIDTVSGIIYAASGYLFDDIEGVSGLLYEASGLLRDDLTIVSGIANGANDEASILAVSGMVLASGALLDGKIDIVSGIAVGNTSEIEAVSGMVLSSGASLETYVDAVSGVAWGNIDDITTLDNSLSEVASGNTTFYNLLVDLNDVDNGGTGGTAKITRTRSGDFADSSSPTNVRIENSGDGSRVILDSIINSGDFKGNAWGVVSLSDGAFRAYGYRVDIPVEVSGILTGTNQIILDSGWAWNNILPFDFRGIFVSGSFINGGDPEGLEITSQFPHSGHILTLDGTPSSTSVPTDALLLGTKRNGITISKNSDVGIDLDPQSITSKLDIRGDSIRIRNSGVVPTNTSDGYKGEIRWDDSYLYVCTANNSWKRVALDGTPWS